MKKRPPSRIGGLFGRNLLSLTALRGTVSRNTANLGTPWDNFAKNKNTKKLFYSAPQAAFF